MKSDRDKRIEKAALEIAQIYKELRLDRLTGFESCKDLLASIKLTRERKLTEPDTRFEDSITWDNTSRENPKNYTGD